MSNTSVKFNYDCCKLKKINYEWFFTLIWSGCSPKIRHWKYFRFNQDFVVRFNNYRRSFRVFSSIWGFSVEKRFERSLSRTRIKGNEREQVVMWRLNQFSFTLQNYPHVFLKFWALHSNVHLFTKLSPCKIEGRIFVLDILEIKNVLAWTPITLDRKAFVTL